MGYPVKTIQYQSVVYLLPLVNPGEGEQLVTKLDVFNIAALALGFAEGVSDPDENTAVASVLRKRWTTARRSFLEEHPYNGCKRTVDLNLKTTPPVDRWTNMFSLPYDCLRVMTINGFEQNDGIDSWEVEHDLASNERVLLTNASSAKAALLVDVPDLTHLKTKVIEAMGLYLAYQVNEVFPMSSDKRAQMEKKMSHAISMTKGTDGQEGTPPRRTESWLVQSRRRRRR